MLSEIQVPSYVDTANPIYLDRSSPLSSASRLIYFLYESSPEEASKYKIKTETTKGQSKIVFTIDEDQSVEAYLIGSKDFLTVLLYYVTPTEEPDLYYVQSYAAQNDETIQDLLDDLNKS